MFLVRLKLLHVNAMFFVDNECGRLPLKILIRYAWVHACAIAQQNFDFTYV